MGQKRYEIQLKDHVTGEVILGSGGMAVVCTQGTSAQASLLNADGSAKANPVTLNNGRIEFEVADTVTQVDIYGMAPGGEFYELLAVKPSGPNEIAIDQGRSHHTMKIPFDHADYTAAAETDSGFDEPANAIMLPNAAVRVVNVDATESIDVGTDSNDSGDADGFLDGASVATAGIAKGTLASGGQTLGALLRADESGAGVLVPEGHVSTEKSITYTVSAGSDTAAGFILLPYVLG